MIETKDIWQSAYLLSEGGWLVKVAMERRQNKKKVATFILTGQDMESLAQRFKDGQAVCNVKKLKTHVSYLKQIIFGKQETSEEEATQKTQTGENHHENRPECFREHQTLELA